MKAEQNETKKMSADLIINKLLTSLDKNVFSKVVEVKEYFEGNEFRKLLKRLAMTGKKILGKSQVAGEWET